ncbi:MAG: penicillin acylase family protein [Anaerolineales bacterium]|jgi:penicillin amidase
MKKISKWILIILIVVLVGGAIYVAVMWPGWVEAGYPQTDGELKLTGLDGPVDIYRDENGVPHIYASTEHDLIFAQGYVHAQDRFYQMDFQRHNSTGRLSEMLGSSLLEVDKFLRTLGWERVSREELDMIDEHSLSIMEAYAEGVNAYLADHEGAELGMEYVFLPLLNPGYEPEPWEPLDTISWAKAMSWQLGGNLDTEIERAVLLATLTPEQIAALYPPYPEDYPTIVKDWDSASTGYPVTAQSDLLSHFTTAFTQVSEQAATIDTLFDISGAVGIGSNSWAVSGDLTTTGMPLLASDMHLPANIPHVWYENGLHCMPKGPDCQLDVVGVSFVGAPMIIVGHNDRIAWAYTNVGPDVMDLYIEKINPDNPYQYEVNGEWVDMEVLTEDICVGDDIIELEVRLTRHGPIITEVFGLEEFHEESGLDLPENYAIALQWTALKPNKTFQAVMMIDFAQNWEEFREAAKDFAAPAQNLLYADIEGNIGYQMPGDIPIRAGDSDGRYPVPGWTDDHEWLGYIPFEEHPYTFNPPEGYIATANNAVVDSSYPYQIADVWSYGQRAERIENMILEASGPIDIPYFQQMHGDNKSLTAEMLVPYLLSLDMDDIDLENAKAILNGWDFQEDKSSPEAALFEAFWKHLLMDTFTDDLPDGYAPDGSDRWAVVMRSILDDPENPWWDDITTTDVVEGRDDIIRLAFESAFVELKKMLGKDPNTWQWGEIHYIVFQHEVMSSFPFIKKAFNRGPFALSGGTSIVNANGWNAAGDDYRVYWTPSERMIVDFNDLTNSLLIHPTGQSGHPYHPHYIDMAEKWANIEYNPLLWELETIQTTAEGHLRLIP